jgi:hypothetical protein
MHRFARRSRVAFLSPSAKTSLKPRIARFSHFNRALRRVASAVFERFARAVIGAVRSFVSARATPSPAPQRVKAKNLL